MSFLDKLFEQLRSKKTGDKPVKSQHFKEVFKGYRFIPIQELENRKLPKH